MLNEARPLNVVLVGSRVNDGVMLNLLRETAEERHHNVVVQPSVESAVTFLEGMPNIDALIIYQDVDFDDKPISFEIGSIARVFNTDIPIAVVSPEPIRPFSEDLQRFFGERTVATNSGRPNLIHAFEALEGFVAR